MRSTISGCGALGLKRMRCVTRSGAGVGGAAEVDACAVGVDGPLSLSAVGTFDTVGGLFYGFKLIKITIAIIFYRHKSQGSKR